MQNALLQIMKIRYILQLIDGQSVNGADLQIFSDLMESSRMECKIHRAVLQYCAVPEMAKWWKFGKKYFNIFNARKFYHNYIVDGLDYGPFGGFVD